MANSPIPVELEAARTATREWPRRYTVVVLFALATALCYIDRVNISIAIIPLARAKGYDAAAKGLVLSSFFWGYLWLQLLGGWMADRFGGKRVLAAGVAMWSLATFFHAAGRIDLVRRAARDARAARRRRGAEFPGGS